MTTEQNQYINVMCDLETLGTRPGCKLLSIAAVPFLLEKDEDQLASFYEKIRRDSYYVVFHEDISTLLWWEDQSKEARVEAFSGNKGIAQVLGEFTTWCSSITYNGRKILFWGNGADFDNAILQETYKLCGLKAPWEYFNNRCYRTLKALFPQIPYTKPKIAHNALEDAKAQAVHAEHILRTVEACEDHIQEITG